MEYLNFHEKLAVRQYPRAITSVGVATESLKLLHLSWEPVLMVNYCEILDIMQPDQL